MVLKGYNSAVEYFPGPSQVFERTERVCRVYKIFQPSNRITDYKILTIDGVNIDVLYFHLSRSPSLAADNQGAWVGFTNCLAAWKFVLHFCMICTEESVCLIKISYKLPRRSLYKRPCVQYINNPFLRNASGFCTVNTNIAECLERRNKGCYFGVNTLTWFRNFTVWKLRIYLRLSFSMHCNLIRVWMYTCHTLSVGNIGNNTYLPLETFRFFKRFWVSHDTPIPEFLNRRACRVRKALSNIRAFQTIKILLATLETPLQNVRGFPNHIRVYIYSKRHIVWEKIISCRLFSRIPPTVREICKSLKGYLDFPIFQTLRCLLCSHEMSCACLKCRSKGNASGCQPFRPSRLFQRVAHDKPTSALFK